MPLFLRLHTNEIPRTDPLAQVDDVRVVDLDIGASKSDNLRDRSASLARHVGIHVDVQNIIRAHAGQREASDTGMLGSKRRR